MKKRLVYQAISLASAAVMCFTPLLNFSGAGISAAAAEQTAASGALVDVIVTVAGDAILATDAGAAEGADYLSTDAAAKQKERIAAKQKLVQNQIRRFYPALEVQFSYDVLVNGFSCKVPENLLAMIRNLPDVEDVSEVQIQSVPKMSKAAAMSGFPAYYDATGCTGEGMVVAVVDSELDITNPMFSAIDDKNVALTKDDIAEIADTIGFNADIDVDRAYVSSKLPFVVDYADELYDGVHDPDAYHGTHVSGIAAGNEVVDYEGKTISGIAKDAQIVFFATSVVSEMGIGISDAAALAATEDAIKLHADVINMSFGSQGEAFTSSPFDEMMENAANAGIVICKAAGNSGFEMSTPDNPDIGTLDPWIDDAHIMTVASAQNTFIQHYKTFTAGGEVIPYAESLHADTGLTERFYIGDQLPEKEYQINDVGDGFEYFGDILMWLFTLEPDEGEEGGEEDYGEEIAAIKAAAIANGYADLVREAEEEYGGGEEDILPGEEEEYEAPDFTDQIIVLNYAMFPPELFAEFAAQYGAVGVICVYPASFEHYAVGMQAEASLPIGFIDEANAVRMRDTGAETIVFTDEEFDMELPTEVSVFSSWGVHQNLELRPDIMGIGGLVESAAYDGKQDVMSGTSMATPYLAGCTAVLAQQLRKTNPELSGLEKFNYIRNLLMNTAVPYAVDDVLVTPRRQGAGLVNVSNAIAAKALMTGSKGYAKVELYDELTNSFSFDVTLTNISDEAVSFKNAALKLTTDTVTEDEEYGVTFIDGGQQPLTSEADLSGLTAELAAGESKTVTVSVTLDKKQTRALKKVFVNGFFVEGFLLLDGAENSAAISIPVLGYFGDWTSIPILAESDEAYIPTASIGTTASLPMSESLATLYRLVIDASSRITDEEREDEWFDLTEALYEHLTDEEMEQLWSTFYEIGYFSPNGDGLADQLGMVLAAQRYCYYMGLDILDKDGNVLLKGDEGYTMERQSDGALMTPDGINTLADGEYTARASAYINYEKSMEAPESVEVPFIIDNEAPQVKTKLRTVGDRQILCITAADQALDGIYVFGTGTGFEVGKEDSTAAVTDLDQFYSMTYTALSLKGSGMTFPPAKADADALPLIGKFLYGNLDYADVGETDFIDVIPLTPDENGKCTVEYDVTDLQDYTIDIMDKAMNVNEIKSELPAPEGFYWGLWLNRSRVLSIHEETFNWADRVTGEVTKATYTLEDGVLTVTDENGNVTKAEVRVERESKLYLTYDDGTTEVFYYRGGDKLSDFFFYTVNEIEEAVIEHVNTMYAPIYGFEITKTEAFVSDYNTVVVNIWVNYQGMETMLGFYQVDQQQGIGADAFDDIFDINALYPPVGDPFIEGMWLAEDQDGSETGYFYFEPEWGYGVIRSLTDGTYSWFDYKCLPAGISFAFEEPGVIDPPASVGTVEQVDAHTVILTWADGTTTTLRYKSSERLDTFTFFSADELCIMSINDYAEKTGEFPADAAVIEAGKGKVTIGIYSEEGELVETYVVDTKTGTGTDSEGEAVNLPQTGNNDITPIVTASGAILMLIFGAYVMSKSGVLRRKEENI